MTQDTLDTTPLQPNVLMFAGPNGSGKSTATPAYLEIFDGLYINADDIAKELEPDIADCRLLDPHHAGRANRRRTPNCRASQG
jgi:predicted ABC-type ATPase